MYWHALKGRGVHPTRLYNQRMRNRYAGVPLPTFSMTRFNSDTNRLLRHGALLALLVLLPVVATAAVPIGGHGDIAPNYDTSDVVMLVVYLGGAIMLSFLCSIAEAVLLSINPSFIAGMREARPRLAATLAKLRVDNVDQSLAAILTLNTIAHTAGAIGSGAKATLVFGSAWVGAFSALATLLILFLSEIVPKTLGTLHWRSLASPVALFIRVLIVMLYPLIKVSELLTRMLSGGKQAHVFSREEFIAMADVGEASGHIDERESRILRNLFGMSSLRARDVMTPRVVIQALPASLSVADALETIARSPFSRLPLYKDTVDNIVGFVLKSDLTLAQARGEGRRAVSEFRRDLLSVPPTVSLSHLLEMLLDKRQQIALVNGEYGETEGLVSLEDVVETLLGDEIVDESDHVDDMRKLARQRWEQRSAATRAKPPARN